MDYILNFIFAILIGLVSGIVGMYFDTTKKGFIPVPAFWFLGAITGMASMMIVFYPLIHK